MEREREEDVDTAKRRGYSGGNKAIELETVEGKLERDWSQCRTNNRL